MTQPLILITGATGKTGTPVVGQLLDHGYSVRAMVRHLDERSQQLSNLGADVVLADFHDLPSLRVAMKDVQRVYFCYPPFDGLLQATTNVAIAAREAGIEVLVNMSQITARENAPSPLSYQHWQAEQVLSWANIGAVHINPTFFAENLYLFTGQSIADESKMYLPYGDARHAPVAAADIARVVVAILGNPQLHIGQRYVITGPQSLTMIEMAKILSTELGKSIEYVNLPIDQWHRVLLQSPIFPDYLAKHLAHVAQDHQDGVFDVQTNVVEQVTGQAPQSLAEFVHDHHAFFTGDTAQLNAA